MKVGFITPSVSRSAGGIFEIERRLAQSLIEIPDIEINIYAVKDEFTLEDLYSWAPLTPHVFPFIGLQAFGFAPKLLKSLLKSNIEIGHLHVMWQFTSIATLLWHKKTKTPYIITINGMLDPWAQDNSKWKKFIVKYFYELACLRNAYCLQANTYTEYEAIRGFGLKNPVCIIPNGVDLPQNRYSKNEAPWRDFISGSTKVLLYLGRIHPKKGLTNLIEAWNKVIKKVIPENWNLIIAGWSQGGYERNLKLIVKKYKLEGSVHFIGPQFNTDKEKCYFNADAFILPSFGEGLPMAVLEAWANSLPVLMSPQCNLPIGFSIGAALEVHTNSESIAVGLQILFDRSDEERKEIGMKGKQLVENNYTWKQTAIEMQKVYDWALGGPLPKSVLLK